MPAVKISIASMWQRFNGCEPEYIRDVCHARCCDAPSRPGGTLISIHESEVPVIVRRGGEVRDGLLVTDGVCTFKTDDHLCSLHFTPDKPFGCIASPFTLNKTDTLIVRNRYRSLKCYRPHDRSKGLGIPAYEAFRASLDLIFGRHVASEIVLYVTHVREGAPRFQMPQRSYDILKANDEVKRASH